MAEEPRERGRLESWLERDRERLPIAGGEPKVAKEGGLPAAMSTGEPGVACIWIGLTVTEFRRCAAIASATEGSAFALDLMSYKHSLLLECER